MEIDDRIQAIKDEWGKAHKGERRWGMLAVILFIAGWAAGQLDFHDASVGLFIGTGGMVLVYCPVNSFTDWPPSFSLWAGWIRV